MKYGSVCSGIEAATVAWHPLGWKPSFFSEIEAFPRSVLAHRYPDTPLHGDFTTIKKDQYGPIDLLVGGTPCQSFSVAGLRGGLADDRGNLSLEFLCLAERTRPRWLLWENVPGVLSIDGGRAFGSILGGMAQLGYGFAYRILDAQFFGVPQRRRRVFVVGYFGDWRPAAAVLFERESLRGDSPPSREEGKSVATLTANGVGTCGADDNQGQAGHLIASTGGTAHCLNAGGMGRQDPETETLIAHTLSARHDSPPDGTGRGTPIVPVATAFERRFVRTTGGQPSEELNPTLRADANTGDGAPCVAYGYAVRRLTPRECERLQGFLDDYTLVPHRGKLAADGPRYRAIGNSMAVPVMRWIGERIEKIERMT